MNSGSAENGATLLEVSVLFSVVSAIVTLAAIMVEGGRRILEVEDITLQVEMRVQSTFDALRRGYNSAHCPPRNNPLNRPSFPLTITGMDWQYWSTRQNGFELINSTETNGNLYTAEIFGRPNVRHPPYAVVALHPRPMRWGDRVHALAEGLGVYCDDDFVASTREVCDGLPGLERLVWFGKPVVKRGAQRRKLVLQWLENHSVDCSDGMGGGPNGFCDPNGSGMLGPAIADFVDLNGDGMSDLEEVDRNRDGLLDFDVDGDWDVDREDYYAWGC